MKMPMNNQCKQVKTRSQADDAEKKEYWTTQMEAAYAMMENIAEYPVVECGEEMVSLREEADKAGVSIEFSTTRIAGRFERVFYLRRSLVPDVLAIAEEMRKYGWTLKIEDAFRSCEMQKYLARAKDIFDNILKRVLWETAGKLPSPNFILRRITAVVATYPKIGTHMSGSAIDISAVHADTKEDVDLGGVYTEMSVVTPMASPYISVCARKNRDKITTIMKSHAFMAYPFEFWHYSKGDAYSEFLMKTGKTARYGAIDLDIERGEIVSIAEPRKLLNSLNEIQEEIGEALKRLNLGAMKCDSCFGLS